MASIPRPEEFPGIRARLRFYKVTAWITGILLLALVVEMVLKYAFHLEIEMFGPFGLFALVQEGTVTAFNLSRWILIIHGWFYVVYLIAAYFVWLKMRWELVWLLAMAGGGVVPFLSFATEMLMAKRAHRELEAAQAHWDARVAEDEKLAAIEDSLSEDERARLDADVEAEVAAEVKRRSQD